MTREKRLLDAYQVKMDLLKMVRQLMEEKTSFLVAHDFTRLEKSLESESSLQQTLMDQDRRIQECKNELAETWNLSPDQIDWRCLSLRCHGDLAVQVNQLRSGFRSVTEKIRSLNRKNLALIQNGQLWAETLLSAICPAPTYHPEMNGKTGLLPSRLSVNC